MKNKEAELCPKCVTNVLEEVPALSRRDNKTLICSDCGREEAFEDFIDYIRKESK